MSYDLSKLKKSTSALTKALEATQKGFQKDERYWTLTVDKAGNGVATIRFLDGPLVDEEEKRVPFVQKYSYGFKGPGGWYIENSLSTFNQPDPVGEYNSALWNTEIKANQDIARSQKRQLDYISNILVVKDSMNPSAEGKVFLFRYGAEIFGKVQERLPELRSEDEMATTAEGVRVLKADEDFLLFNPYNYYDGANFKLKARKKEGGFRTYTDSVFLAPTKVGSDTEIGKLWNESYSLLAEVNPNDKKLFKPYVELKARLDKVLGLNSGATSHANETAEAAVAAEVEDAVSAGVVPDDSDMDVFRKLANG